MTRGHRILVAVSILALALAAPALAHITPSVILVSDRDALRALLSGGQKFFVREVRLASPERAAVKQQTGWSPDEDFYRFYLARDAQGGLVGAATFVTEFTVHGPVRVAVGLGPDGRVKGATVVELTEETYAWVKPLIDRDFTKRYVGRTGHDRFPAAAGGRDMTHFYEEVLAGLIQRAALLWEIGVVRRGDAA